VEKGLKAWYSSLGNVGKAIDSVSLWLYIQVRANR
jgi:hypothetical protein